MDTDYKGANAEGLEVANKVTPSVLALAKVAKVTAEALAQAIADTDAIEAYRSDVAQALMKAFVKKAVEEAKVRKTLTRVVCED